MNRLPNKEADVVFIHAPAIYEFRDRGDIYFPFLGTSGDVPITPLYEYFPVGFKSLELYLTHHGYKVALINLCSLFLSFRNMKLETIINALDTKLIGIDLHWMVHVQGSLAVAKEIKEKRPDIKIIFGGISSSYYAEELICREEVDMVMRGYDTHIPMKLLLEQIKTNGKYENIPNLLWKSESGQIKNNGLTHKPAAYGYRIDWTQQPKKIYEQSLPIREIISVFNAGCKNNCGWCGGSSYAFKNIYNNKEESLILKSETELKHEYATINKLGDLKKNRYHLYSVGLFNCSNDFIERILALISDTKINSISYEISNLVPEDILRKIAAANKRTILTLSPESHDIRISKLAGRGNYTNRELEVWIRKALEKGIYQIDLWYFIGMKGQDAKSVSDTVAYCEYLLRKFEGKRVYPYLCPMIPFLDPGSMFFENPQENGYRTFFKTLEEHRTGMENASIINRINYETKWLSREQIVKVGFNAVKRLMEVRAELGNVPGNWARNYTDKIDDALQFIDIVHEIDCLENKSERKAKLHGIKEEILKRNEMILYSGVMNQAFPLKRDIGGRWFDCLGWDPDLLKKAI